VLGDGRLRQRERLGRARKRAMVRDLTERQEAAWIEDKVSL
jgi:hypothetical protein